MAVSFSSVGFLMENKHRCFYLFYRVFCFTVYLLYSFKQPLEVRMAGITIIFT